MKREQVIACLIVGMVLVCAFTRCALKKREITPEKASAPFEYRGYSFPEYESYVRNPQYVEMSDGVKLAVDVYLPTDGPERKNFPVAFRFTPYSRAFIIPNGAWQARLGVKSALGTWGPVIDDATLSLTVRTLLSHGYAYVYADMRGNGASFGHKLDFMPQISKDGGELIEWISKQPWCDGNVGMFGASYLGWSQLATASNKHPALKCIFPEVVPLDGYSEMVYPGGIYINFVAENYLTMLEQLNSNYFIFNIGKIISSKSPTASGAICFPSAPAADEDGDGDYTDEIPIDLNGNGTFLDDYKYPDDPDDPPRYHDGQPRKHLYYLATKDHGKNIDAYSWSSTGSFIDATGPGPFEKLKSYDMSPSGHVPGIMESGIAICHNGGWHDLFSRGTTQLYSTMKKTNFSKMIIDAGYHTGTGPYWEYFGINSKEMSRDGDKYTIEKLRFFDHYLKGIENGIENEPPVYIYVQGYGWRFEKEWPLARQVIRNFYFDAGNALSAKRTMNGTDKYKADFTHDSRYGKTGGNRYMAGFGVVPEILPTRTQKDKQCLTYTSPPMRSDTEITGHPIIHFWTSSTADYGDFFVYIEDVTEDEEAILVTEGMLRAGFANLYDNNEIIRSGQTGIDVIPDLPWHGFEKAEYTDKIFAGDNIVEIKIDLLPVSWVFKKGHRIRISIACANWPTFRLHPKLAPNNKPDDPANTIPTITIYRDEEHPSRISLPVIPCKYGVSINSYLTGI